MLRSIDGFNITFKNNSDKQNKTIKYAPVRQAFVQAKLRNKALFKKIKSYYFVLRSTGIFWYRKIWDTRPKGSISLKGLYVPDPEGNVEKGKFPLKFEHRNTNTNVTMFFKTNEQRTAWFDDIKKVRELDGIPIEYKGITGTLNVTVVEADDLRAADYNGKSDPFTMLCMDQSTEITTVKKKTLSPQWDESFNFIISQLPCLLKVYVFDDDKLSKSDSLGFAVIDIAEIARQQTKNGVTHVDGWYPLSSTTHAENNPKGRIRLVISAAYEANFVENPIFNEELSLVMKRPDHQDYKMPIVVIMTLCYLYKNALESEGIFRLSGSFLDISKTKEMFDKGNFDQVKFGAETSHHLVSGILKLYLRELPAPLTLFLNYEAALEIGQGDEDKSIAGWQSIMQSLPEENFIVLKHLIYLLFLIDSKASVNMMRASNLSIVFGPVLVKEQSANMEEMIKSVNKVNTSVEYLIKNFPDIFECRDDILLPLCEQYPF